MLSEDYEQAQYLSAQVEQARQRAVLAASDSGASRDDARLAEQQAREHAKKASQVVVNVDQAVKDAQDAADRAEAPTDSMVAELAGNPVSLTRAAVDSATGTMINTAGSTTQAAGDARWVTQAGADFTVAELLGRPGSLAQVAADERYPALLQGVVSATQLPPATSIGRGILSLGQVAAAAADTVSTAMSSTVNLDELQHNILIDSYRGVNTNVPNGIATILYAPYKMRITRLSLIFDVWSKAVSATDYASFTLRRYDPATNTGASIAVKHTSQEAVTTRKPWGFDAVTWNAGTAVIEAGQAVSLGWANQGGSLFTLPMLVSIGVEPV